MTTETNVSNVNRFANLYSLFQFAVAQNLKYPKLRLQLSSAETVVVKLAGNKSRYEGQLMEFSQIIRGEIRNPFPIEHEFLVQEALLAAAGYTK